MDEVMLSLKNMAKDGLHYSCAETEEIAENALAFLEDYKNHLQNDIKECQNKICSLEHELEIAEMMKGLNDGYNDRSG